MVQTLSHTELLDCKAEDAWRACKHADEILTELLPEYFAKAEFLEGNGGPGSIRVFTLGPAIPQVGLVKERIDRVDDASRTLGYTVMEGDPRYSSFAVEMRYAPVTGDTATEATWTATYEPIGDMGPPEHVKAFSIIIFKTFESAIKSRQTYTYSEKLGASPDALWSTCVHGNAILQSTMPEYFESATFTHGHGEVGSIRAIKFGPAASGFTEIMTERIEAADTATKTLNYTILKGNPQYKYLNATMSFNPGPEEGTTDAIWTAEFVPAGADVGPPEHIKDIIVLVWKALEGAAKLGPNAYA